MFKILLIEDQQSDIDVFESSMRRFGREKNIKCQLEYVKTFEEGIKKISEEYSGIIVDIRLNGCDNGGDIVKNAVRTLRVPVVILTGTPNIADEQFESIKIYKKGAVSDDEILDFFLRINNKKIVDVLGCNGLINKYLIDIYRNNFYPNIDYINKLLKRSSEVEGRKALFRYILANIQEKMDVNGLEYFAEEMYVLQTDKDLLKTGMIVKDVRNDEQYVILSPPCDLVPRNNGNPKNENVLLCHIDDFHTIKRDIEYSEKDGKKKKQKEIEKLIKNNLNSYYHWLPEGMGFTGGCIKFRKVVSLPLCEWNDKIIATKIKIQDAFVKNILNRFSSY